MNRVITDRYQSYHQSQMCLKEQYVTGLCLLLFNVTFLQLATLAFNLENIRAWLFIRHSHKSLQRLMRVRWL